MISAEEMAFVTRVLAFFETLGDDDKRRVEAQLYKRTFEKGVVLHHGKEDCAGLFILKSGYARAYLVSDEGKEITLFRVVEGECCMFTAACMLPNIDFDVVVEAGSDMEAFILPSSLYSELSGRHLAVADFTNELMARRFSDVMWVMEQIVFMSFDKRLATFLLEQAQVEGTEKLRITHEEIAQHIGTAREVVSRMLKYFVGEGLVRLSRGGIELLAKDKLKRLTV